MRRLLLASTSPRRRELFSCLTRDFDVLAPEVDETLAGAGGAQEAVRLLAERKAEVALEHEPDRLVLAADTLVSLEGRILGKPANDAAARDYLRGLRGRWHSVSTGVCLAARGIREQYIVTTRVCMRPLSDEEIEASIKTGVPFDKAGAYAIQDRILQPVSGIDGCYCNVMGLPLWDVWRMLAQQGVGADLRPPDAARHECIHCPRRS